MDCSMDNEQAQQNKKYGGESGIRTHVTLSSKHAFQACAFSHSAISPEAGLLREAWAAVHAQTSGSALRFYGSRTGNRNFAICREIVKSVLILTCTLCLDCLPQV